jgi:hypothetical protein
VNNACTDLFGYLDEDFHSSSPEVQDKLIGNICCDIAQRIHSTGTDPAMAQSDNDQGSFDEDFFDYVLEVLLELPDCSSNRFSSFVAATEASIQFSAVLHMRGSAITSSSQPIPCRNHNTNSNNITSITNIISAENPGLVIGNTIVEGAM